MTKDPYVRFWIEDGVEVAMCTAADFREAMNERDRLRAALEKAEEMATACEALVEHSHEDQPDCCELGEVIESRASREITQFMYALEGANGGA